MITSFQVLQILIYLVPGLIAEKMVISLTEPVKSQSDISKIINALIFSVLIYVLVYICANDFPIIIKLNNNQFSKIEYKAIPIVLTISFTFLLPVLISILKKYDLHMKLMRIIKITNNTSRRSVWSDIFLNVNSYITINFIDGRRLQGLPTQYSNDPDEPFIYIKKPTWIITDDEGKINELQIDKIDGILITPEMKIESIEIYQKESK